jgi:hypothetical protein
MICWPIWTRRWQRFKAEFFTAEAPEKSKDIRNFHHGGTEKGKENLPKMKRMSADQKNAKTRKKQRYLPQIRGER